MSPNHPEFDDIPEGWDIEIIQDGDKVRYKYTELSTGERIKGTALASHYRSPSEDIRRFIHERAEHNRLKAAGVTGSQIARKILEMVGKLHEEGMESLYIDSYMAPSGCYWRYSIGIASEGLWPQRNSIGTMEEGGPEGSIGGGFDQEIPWCNPDDTLEEYTSKFIDQYSQNLKSAKEANPGYVRWYREMLDKTSPSGIMIFGSDMGPWYEYAYTWGDPEDFHMPMPPGYSEMVDETVS